LVLATRATLAVAFLVAARSVFAALLGGAALPFHTSIRATLTAAALHGSVFRPRGAPRQGHHRREQRGLPIFHQHELSLLPAEGVGTPRSGRDDSKGGRHCQHQSGALRNGVQKGRRTSTGNRQKK